MNPKATMIDLETLSLQPNAYILQVGIATADLDTGVTSTSVFKLRGQEGRHIDPSTVAWWMKQDHAVAEGVFDFDDKMICVTPAQAWDIIKSMSADTIVWSNPSTFDLVVLKDLFGGKTPWSHRHGMCLKTLAEALDPWGNLRPPNNAKAHDALADAVWQMEYLRALYRIAPSDSSVPSTAGA